MLFFLLHFFSFREKTTYKSSILFSLVHRVSNWFRFFLCVRSVLLRLPSYSPDTYTYEIFLFKLLEELKMKRVACFLVSRSYFNN